MFALGSEHLLECGIKTARNAPTRVMAFEFCKIRNVTDVITPPGLFWQAPARWLKNAPPSGGLTAHHFTTGGKLIR